MLGRILRITDGNNQEAWLYTFAEASLVKFSEEIEQDIPESCLYVKSPELNEQQSPSSVSTGEIPSLVTPKIRGSLVWSDVFGELTVEENDKSFNSFTLGHFRERVIEAFSAI